MQQEVRQLAERHAQLQLRVFYETPASQDALAPCRAGWPH
jgi:hypothetical protein